jgi:hypothetical protein
MVKVMGKGVRGCTGHVAVLANGAKGRLVVVKVVLC